MKLTIRFKGLCMFVGKPTPGPGDTVRVLLPDTNARSRHRDGTAASKKHHAAIVVMDSTGAWQKHCDLKGGVLHIQGTPAATQPAATPVNAAGQMHSLHLGSLVRISDFIDCLTPCTATDCKPADPHGPLGRLAAELSLAGGTWSTMDIKAQAGRIWRVTHTPGPIEFDTVAVTTTWDQSFDGEVTISGAGCGALKLDQDTEICITNTDDPPEIAAGKTHIVHQPGPVPDDDFRYFYGILGRKKNKPLADLPIPVAQGTVIDKQAEGIVAADTPTCLECLLDPDGCPE